MHPPFLGMVDDAFSALQGVPKGYWNNNPSDLQVESEPGAVWSLARYFSALLCGQAGTRGILQFMCLVVFQS